MFDRAHPLALARAAMLPTVCGVIIVYFAVHAVTGNTGLIAWRGYKAQHAVVAAEVMRVAAEKATLARQVALLDPHHVDRDLADELVRRDLGTIRAD
jgi:cell division protein FtsB